jgi:diguanylate cyclase (GGDEF)-like protein
VRHRVAARGAAGHRLRRLFHRSRIGFYHVLEADQETLALQTWSTRTIRECCQAEGAGLHAPVSAAGVWADCVRERRAIIHNDYAALTQRRGLPEGHAQVTRELVVPVVRGERLVAILGVGNKPHDYDASDLDIVSTFADLAWDIVERKRTQSALRQMAHFDALTGLPNRLLLADRLAVARANARRDGHLLAVCYLDLDGFKPVNDTYGHAAGDRLLMTVAERMRRTLRAGDTVARLGGDEFVLLLGRLASAEQAWQTLGRLQSALTTPIELAPDTSAQVSASIGMTLYPLDASDADTLIRHADQAMYAAKQAGRNCVRQFQPDPRQVRPVS